MLAEPESSVAYHHRISDTIGNFTALFENYQQFGTSVCGASDINGDLVADLIVGSPYAGSTGMVEVLFLTRDGQVSSHQRINNTVGQLTATLSYSYFGSGVTEVGYLNTDDVPDLAVGGWGIGDGGFNRGGVFVLFLTTAGTILSHQKISDTAGNLGRSTIILACA